VIDQVLPDASADTAGKLRNRMRRLVPAIQPEAAQRARRKSLEDRDVRCVRHRDGTASIIGRNLPADKAAAAMDHIDRIAGAACQGRGGADSTVAERGERRNKQIRADVFVDLLNDSGATGATEINDAGQLTRRTSFRKASSTKSRKSRSRRQSGRAQGLSRHRRMSYGAGHNRPTRR
jgi:hypothetical protein